MLSVYDAVQWTSLKLMPKSVEEILVYDQHTNGRF